MADEPKNLGPTGEFPDGKLTPRDEGGLAYAVGEVRDKVVINFGTPVASIGMTPQQAVQLAGAILAHARSVARRTGAVISVRI